MSSVDLNDQQLLRYSRQILLSDIDLEGQQKLAESRVLVLGMGGLGSPVATYLAGAGVGQLVLVDPDVVEISNLHRQFLHSTLTLGESKVESALQTLSARNPDVDYLVFDKKLDETDLLEQIKLADVVVDGTDNFATRVMVNKACVATGTPLVYGAVVGLEGQASVFRADREDSPCYNCLYADLDKARPEDSPRSSFENCSGQGVLGPVAGIIGCIQATEAIKVLLELGDSLQGRLLMLDARSMDFRSFVLKRNPECSVCGPAR